MARRIKRIKLINRGRFRTQYHFHISSHLAVDRNVKDYYNIARKFA